MKNLIVTAAFVLLGSFAANAGNLNESIRQFINGKTSDSSYEIDKTNLFSGTLPLFYMNRIFTPAWIDRLPSGHNGYGHFKFLRHADRYVLGKNGHDLLGYIRQVDLQGLQPDDYHLKLIEKYIGKILSFVPMGEEEMMKLDVLLTDAFFLLGSQIYYGKVNPAEEGSSWHMQRKDPDVRLYAKLEEALAANDVAGRLDLLGPRYRSYWRMKEELAFFLALNEHTWPELRSDDPVKPGESNPLLPEIRERLIKLRYPLSDSFSDLFDENLEKQIMLFQKDWGLNPDGVIGKGTLEALNSKPEKIINQLKVNMERFRWLPLQLTEKYIIVNIANFRLDQLVGADTLLSMRAIVGKEYRKTPVFSGRITYIVFSPNWTVPPVILRNDVIPELLKGPAYLEKKNMILLRPDGSEIAYSAIDWSKVSKNNFPYMVRQNPGPENALGRVKFMFPNVYDIYIHDTPSRGYFARDDRAMSSGCVRIEKPYELALSLLSDMPDWTPEQIQKAMRQQKEQTVTLKTPVDVVLIYLTAWTDGSDRIQLRKDVYLRDGLLLNALNRKPI